MRLEHAPDAVHQDVESSWPLVPPLAVVGLTRQEQQVYQQLIK